MFVLFPWLFCLIFLIVCGCVCFCLFPGCFLLFPSWCIPWCFFVCVGYYVSVIVFMVNVFPCVLGVSVCDMYSWVYVYF